MNEKPAIEEGRAPLDLNIDDLPPPRDKPKLSKEAKLAAGAGAGFSEDETETVATAPAVALSTKHKPKKKPATTAGTERPWRRTGRTHPVNTNIKPEYNDALMELVAQLSEREGRPVSKAEVLERAIELLRADQTQGQNGGHQ